MFRSGGAGDPMPWGMAVLLAIALPAVGVLLIVGGRRAREGRLRRNHFIGIRTTLTLNSDEAWDAAHLAGGHLLSVAAPESAPLAEVFDADFHALLQIAGRTRVDGQWVRSYRGRQYDRDKTCDVRIVCLGGSTTWGAHLATEETWPSRPIR